jgi:hypothetical protein
MWIQMDQNYQLFQRLVQLVCYLLNQNDHELFENKGIFILKFFNKIIFLFFFSGQTRMHEHHHFHRHDEGQLNEEELRQMAMRTHDTVTTHPHTTATTTTTKNESTLQTPGTPIDKVTNLIGTTKVDPRNDGALSDSILSSQPDSNKKRRPSMSSKALVILGLSKKTNSTSNLGYGNYIYIIKCQKYN